MTKTETAKLLDAVRNAPIINGVITVVVSGTTFTFGQEFGGRISEGYREILLNAIKENCRMKMVRTYSKKELNSSPMRTQELLLWWKKNIDKGDLLIDALNRTDAFDKKWKNLTETDCSEMTAELWYDYRREKTNLIYDYKKLGVEKQNLRRLVELRSCIPAAWVKA